MKALPPLADALRQATRHEHRRLDHHPLMRALMSPRLACADYMRALKALYSPQVAMEHAITHGLAYLCLDYAFAPRAALLSDDLAALGAGRPRPAIQSRPAPVTLSSLLGWLYVIEGSRLGARVIVHHVRQRLGANMPLAFFASADDSHGWPRFWTFVAQQQQQIDPEAAILAARQTFALFVHHLEASIDTGQPPGMPV